MSTRPPFLRTVAWTFAGGPPLLIWIGVETRSPAKVGLMAAIWALIAAAAWVQDWELEATRKEKPRPRHPAALCIFGTTDEEPSDRP